MLQDSGLHLGVEGSNNELGIFNQGSPLAVTKLICLALPPKIFFPPSGEPCLSLPDHTHCRGLCCMLCMLADDDSQSDLLPSGV